MVDKHFFKPLLPGFHNHLTIPIAFLSKHIERRYDQTTAKLRSDASKKTWEVKIENGQRLTAGWKEFALAHDLRIGDILIFRQEKDMAYHVTLLGPSCCEIQYESCLEDDNNLGNTRKKKIVKKNPRKEIESASIDLSSFESNVAPSTLRYDRLDLPMSFTRKIGLSKRCGEIVLMNEKGKSWTLNLKRKKSSRVMYITRGWRIFCCANGLRAGDLFTFKLIQGGRTLVLRLSSTESKEEDISENDEVEYLSTEPETDEDSNLERIPKKKNPRKEKKSSSLDPSCFVAYVSPASVQYDKMNLPRSFVRENSIEIRSGEMLLMNKMGKSWTLALKQEPNGTTYIRTGWRSFCSANGLKTGGLYTFILVQRGRTPVLRLSSTESESEEESSEGTDEVESLSTEPESDEETNLEKTQSKKTSKRDTESSSLEPSCYVANVTPSGLREDRLILKKSFVKENDLDERCGEIILMNEKSRSWPLNLQRKNSCGTMSLTGGWRSFCRTNGLKAGSFFTFKLIQTGGTLVLRLFSQFQKQFVTLTLGSFNLKRNLLYLPVRFTKRHGISEETKMTMLDKNGVKWSTDLRSNNRGNRIRMVGGWKEFFKANCVKAGETIIVKLIWEGNTSCVLKFCSKVK